MTQRPRTDIGFSRLPERAMTGRQCLPVRSACLIREDHSVSADFFAWVYLRHTAASQISKWSSMPTRTIS